MPNKWPATGMQSRHPKDLCAITAAGFILQLNLQSPSYADILRQSNLRPIFPIIHQRPDFSQLQLGYS
ncbi:hypothetical protein VN97_g7574 [Penicillium thymicola]|uniref:Uncharacterized protein n=1 Tax=Penicillium thymicola TaxID=293382 RepID=A0AAI9TES4_PENTH|nr:hypothetical protein VN97_g7574 [Penicillium thymicola]